MSARAPIVHIGYPKTATTWFQRNFYPRIGNFAYVDRARVRAALLEPNALAFDPAESRRVLGLDEARLPVILCEEGLSGYLHNGGVAGTVSKEMAERIERTLPGARIIIFLRAQPGMIAAAYQQYVRGGGTHGAQRFVFPGDYLIGSNAETYKQPRFDIDHFLYSRLIERYDSLFGRENVHVHLFEQFQRHGASFLRAFADALGLDVDVAAVSMERRLPTYGMALTNIARFLNLFTARSVIDKETIVHIPGWYQARRRLLEAMNRTRLFGSPPSPARLLGEGTARWLEGHFAADNRRLAERGLPVADYGYAMEGDTSRIERPRPGRWRKAIAS